MSIDRRPAVWLDHCVVAIHDLDAGMAAFQSLTGVRPVYGGAHPSLGTHNALVSLGAGCYLEILAPRPGGELHPMVQEVGRFQSLTPILWALATDDLVELRRVVQTAGFSVDEPTPGSRVTREGDTLRWSVCLLGAERPANAPFFIQWEQGTAHPALTAPPACSLGVLTIASVDREQLQQLLGAIGHSLTVLSGPTRTELSLETPHGTVTFHS